MRKRRDFIIWVAAVFFATLVFCALAGSDALRVPDGVLSDLLYQHESATDGEIVIVGIDQRALAELGPMPWPRSVMAEAINYLCSDPEGRVPAVIGIDTLYIGESGDADADKELVEAVKNAGNVYLAASGTIGSSLIEGEDGYKLKTRSVVGWDEP